MDHPDFNSPGKFAGWGYFRGRRLYTDQGYGAHRNSMYEINSNHGTACAGVAVAEADAAVTVVAAPGFGTTFRLSLRTDINHFIFDQRSCMSGCPFNGNKVFLNGNDLCRIECLCHSYYGYYCLLKLFRGIP
ncbi:MULTISPECIES: hypothetical protein [Okeania]|uniref:hypothetical protein n=1 Tax=Okeania TaxID=1458928 RepID=UPI001374B8A0|nr:MULTISPECIES: hypothetical protein [Okeania]NET15618.1 hypothetical protein [Okeania sp. SIO1H6]NES75881.1 hypothetical protein [Okeania sp. SIO1H4]NES91169.1 hypothetical protein [Okeania sp. SIO2B9]NET23698.1 hypothetical protein [Okeania sp. SIO1H5]NET75857.1 hypothetical protein [Okeania sp. SIO1F9]